MKKMKKVKKIVKTPNIKYIPNTKALKLIKLKMQYSVQVCIFIGKKLTEDVKSAFFKASKNEELGCLFVHYKDDPYWTTILRDLGIAKSISDAKGAGWFKKVEEGFQDIVLDGLKKVEDPSKYHNPKGVHFHRITILKDKEVIKANE